MLPVEVVPRHAEQDLLLPVGVMRPVEKVLSPQVHVGQDTRIGAGALLHAGAKIGARCTIGARFIAHFNSVVGNDGFSFVTPEASGVERARESLGDQGEAKGQPWARIASLGGVTIGDDVEVGANTCIDRATVGETRIGQGTKLDNLVQIGHGTRVGRHTIVAGQAGLAGSTRVGDHVMLGGQVGTAGHITIGNRVVATAQTGIARSVDSGKTISGSPEMDSAMWKRNYILLKELPQFVDTIKRLEKEVAELQEKLKTKK